MMTGQDFIMNSQDYRSRYRAMSWLQKNSRILGYVMEINTLPDLWKIQPIWNSCSSVRGSKKKQKRNNFMTPFYG